jgi:DNA/RNA endonuclease YhcR with UshA esterase domain|tara:strand:- start:2001 stop:2414 length:414 start_codon:yes stop_codon:yes gene_type:complete
MKIKKIIIGILVLGIIGAFIAYKMYNKPHVNVEEASADISITADKILNDFSSDENLANLKYLDKIIEVKGVISEINIEKGIITIETNDDFGSVICHLSEEASRKISGLQEGQIIVVKGICTGFLMDVILVKCEFINQ